MSMSKGYDNGIEIPEPKQDYEVTSKDFLKDKNGAFRCPNCNMFLDPSDTSGIAYEVIFVIIRPNPFTIYIRCICSKIIKIVMEDIKNG